MVRSSRHKSRRPAKRIILLIMLLAAVLGGAWYFFPQRLDSAAADSWRAAIALWYHKEVRLSGLEVLREEDLELQQLRGRSLLWWHMNLAGLHAYIRRNSLVRDVLVKRCPDQWWNCFEMSVVEREPSLLAFVGERLWMVGNDGGFMGPVSSSLLEAQDRGEKLEKLGSPPLVRGLLTEGASPDLLKSRLYYVLQSLEIIKRESGLSAAEVSLRSSGEMEVKFLGRNFLAIFGTARDDMEEIKQEAGRLSELLSRFGASAGAIESIDLAFNKRAIVKLAAQQ